MITRNASKIDIKRKHAEDSGDLNLWDSFIAAIEGAIEALDQVTQLRIKPASFSADWNISKLQFDLAIGRPLVDDEEKSNNEQVCFEVRLRFVWTIIKNAMDKTNKHEIKWQNAR